VVLEPIPKKRADTLGPWVMQLYLNRWGVTAQKPLIRAT
jgi:hypothetical protein